MDLVKIGKGLENWFNILKCVGGGCNDFVFSGYMYVVVLIVMVW